eukprot:492305_1
MPSNSRKRNTRDNDDSLPPQKKSKRIKLKSCDNELVKSQLDNGAWKMIDYSDNDDDTYYKYTKCVIDDGNELKYAQMADSSKDNEYNSETHIPLLLSILDTIWTRYECDIYLCEYYFLHDSVKK